MIFKRQITSVLLVNLVLWQIHETIWATLCNMIKFFCRSGSINVFSGKEVLSSESCTVFSWYIKLFYLERSEDIWFVMIWPSVTGQSINNRLFLKPVLHCDVITKQSVLKCAIDCEGQPETIRALVKRKNHYLAKCIRFLWEDLPQRLETEAQIAEVFSQYMVQGAKSTVRELLKVIFCFMCKCFFNYRHF